MQYAHVWYRVDTSLRSPQQMDRRLLLVMLPLSMDSSLNVCVCVCVLVMPWSVHSCAPASEMANALLK